MFFAGQPELIWKLWLLLLPGSGIGMQGLPLWNFLQRKPRRIDMTTSMTSLVHPQLESALHAPNLVCFQAATLATFLVLWGWKSFPVDTEHGSNFSSHQLNRLLQTHLPTRFDRTVIVHSGKRNEWVTERAWNLDNRDEWVTERAWNLDNRDEWVTERAWNLDNRDEWVTEQAWNLVGIIVGPLFVTILFFAWVLQSQRGEERANGFYTWEEALRSH